MYGWTPPPLSFTRLYLALVDLILMFIYYNGLCAFQFDSSAGLSHMVSSAALNYDEKLWLGGNMVVLVVQLLLLAWTTRHVAREADADIRLDLATLVDLLPCWGILRGSRSLHSWLRSKASFLTTLVFVSFHLALLLWSDSRNMRLVTLVFPLLSIDSAASLFAMMTIGNTFCLEGTGTIFTGVLNKPRLYLASYLLWIAAASIIWSYWYSFIILPPLSAAIVLRFLLVRNIPEYVVDPIPLLHPPIIPTNPFCQVCHRTIFAKMRSGTPIFGTSFTHHWTTRSLRKSATEGCRICATVWHYLSIRQTHILNYGFVLGRMTTWEASYTARGNNIVVHSRSFNSICEFSIIDATDRQLRLPFPPRPLEDHTGSDTSLNLAKEWLSQCIQHHQGCCANTDVHFRPSRLLHLSADHQVRLHTSTEYPEALSYMTLSHCWGKAHFIQLQQSNQEELRRGVPWENLPQTFKDAIRIARHLGTEYLWIDSLCILQDSLEDWRTESAMMGSVYKNATCNIAASDAFNSNEGCLYPRNRRIIQLERLPWYSEQSNDLFLRNASHQSKRLYSRAWVLQESILARRTLDCGRDQLFWRCDESKASEELPDGIPPDHSPWKHPHPSHRPVKLLNSLSSLRDMAKEMKTWDTMHQEALQTPGHHGNSKVILRAYDGQSSPSLYWYNIVETYSRMLLTKDTDRPIAIVGTLDVFRPYLGEYLAGMWQNLLPMNLLWSTQQSNFQSEPNHCYRPSDRRGPSWSWISLEGPVHLEEPCEIDYSHELLSQFLNARAVSAHNIRLRIRAPLIHATWVDERAGVVPRAGPAPPITQGLHLLESNLRRKWRVSRDRLRDDDVVVVISIAFDVRSFEETVRDIDLAAIRCRNGMVDGLILQENPDGSFTRFGTFTTHGTAVQIFRRGDEMDIILV